MIGCLVARGRFLLKLMGPGAAVCAGRSCGRVVSNISLGVGVGCAICMAAEQAAACGDSVYVCGIWLWLRS